MCEMFLDMTDKSAEPFKRCGGESFEQKGDF